ncbi:LOW QUALITY PROTEIN: constitutive coactivator of PPAR-gamma-like protein 1 homolog [Bemisia tabaci]|uniref:LOW QUALITY PROTEIN: constitutive coactivator of PPAR-gamma-like protein 1 homolog n=1 Tax=Bemisia tabaci TaxID=7038 RepID=UPI003B27B736
MSTKHLQHFLESGSVEGSNVSVDLVRLARRHVQTTKPKKNQKFTLVVDGECCMDRLYGGFYSDWACGGQWNRMVNYLTQLAENMAKVDVELTFFLNGCVESHRIRDWVNQQLQSRQNIDSVLKHVQSKGTPPPKVWWQPPIGLQSALRIIVMHQIKVNVICTLEDHKQEVIAYCHENNVQGLIADDGEYTAFNYNRYFSAKQLKLTYKGSLETKEYIIPELLKELNITADKLCVIAALLGNHILASNQLTDIYKQAGIAGSVDKVSGDEFVKKLAAYVKDFPVATAENLGSIVEQILGSATDARFEKLKSSIQHYINGTKEGFQKLKPDKRRSKAKKNVESKSGNLDAANDFTQDADLDTSKLASESNTTEILTFSVNEANLTLNSGNPDIVIDEALNENGADVAEKIVNGQNGTVGVGSSSSSSSGAPTSAVENVKSEPESKSSKKQPPQLPAASAEVMRTVIERHSKGLMSPALYQILNFGELKLPAVMEDEYSHELFMNSPLTIHHFYRPCRQMVYAILFNLHHHSFMVAKYKTGTRPDVRIKEWIWSVKNPLKEPEIVKAVRVGWGVPTVKRLWFGTTIDDRRRRLRAFLTCMRSDNPLMLNPDHVPQHLLIISSVLRYIVSSKDNPLRKQELDAFLVTAIDPKLTNVEYTQNLQINPVTSRGISIGALLMQGIETALLVNDACGAPVPWLMSCPWLYFDGKLFQYQLARANVAKNLLELCDHKTHTLMLVERMKHAILDGLNVQFARPMPMVPTDPRAFLAPAGFMPSGMPVAPPIGGRSGYGGGRFNNRGMGRRAVAGPGAKLEIAGVVVGSWSGNYGYGMSRGVVVRPQVSSVGGNSSYGPNGYMRGRPSYSIRGNKSIGKGRGSRGYQANFSKRKVVVKKEKKSPKGRGMTVTLDSGDPCLASDFLNKTKNLSLDDDNSKESSGLHNVLGDEANVSLSEMMNGGGDSNPKIGQFEDLKRDIFGDGQGLKIVLSPSHAAALAQDL